MPGAGDLRLLPLVPRYEAVVGRGLLIVDTLASRWGVEQVAAGGKAVWFELDRPDDDHITQHRRHPAPGTRIPAALLLKSRRHERSGGGDRP